MLRHHRAVLDYQLVRMGIRDPRINSIESTPSKAEIMSACCPLLAFATGTRGLPRLCLGDMYALATRYMRVGRVR